MKTPKKTVKTVTEKSKKASAVKSRKMEPLKSKEVKNQRFDDFEDEEERRSQTEGSYSFGWGYSDTFDKPDEVVEKNEFDEDEQYASGAKSSEEDEDL